MSEVFQEQVANLRRTQILNAAIKVFAEHGFHRTTIHDVAKAAGVADGTIYNYFDNKFALLVAILDPLDDRARPDTTSTPPAQADVRQFLRDHFAQRWAVFDADNMSALRVVLSEVLINPELRPLYIERVIEPTLTLAQPAFEQLVEAGTLSAMDVPLTLRAITATFLGLVVLRLIGDPRLQNQWDDVPDLLATLLLDGMLPRKGGSHDTL